MSELSPATAADFAHTEYYLPPTQFLQLSNEERLAYTIVPPASTPLSLKEHKRAPIVLIIGWTGVKEDWDHLPAHLASLGHSVLVYDHLGCGESIIDANDTRGGRTTVEQLADDCAALIRHVFPSTTGISPMGHSSKVHLLGISMGGMIAQVVAARHTELIETLILGCTTISIAKPIQPPAITPFTLPTTPLTTHAERRALVEKLLALNLTAKWVNENQPLFQWFVDQSLKWSRPMKTSMVHALALQSFDGTKTVKSIQHLPILIIHGQQDGIVPVSQAHVLAQHFPNADLALLPEVGHLFWTQAPKQTNNTLAVFLNKHEETRRERMRLQHVLQPSSPSSLLVSNITSSNLVQPFTTTTASSDSMPIASSSTTINLPPPSATVPQSRLVGIELNPGPSDMGNCEDCGVSHAPSVDCKPEDITAFRRKTQPVVLSIPQYFPDDFQQSFVDYTYHHHVPKKGFSELDQQAKQPDLIIVVVNDQEMQAALRFIDVSSIVSVKSEAGAKQSSAMQSSTVAAAATSYDSDKFVQIEATYVAFCFIAKFMQDAIGAETLPERMTKQEPPSLRDIYKLRKNQTTSITAHDPIFSMCEDLHVASTRIQKLKSKEDELEKQLKLKLSEDATYQKLLSDQKSLEDQINNHKNVVKSVLTKDSPNIEDVSLSVLEANQNTASSKLIHAWSPTYGLKLRLGNYMIERNQVCEPTFSYEQFKKVKGWSSQEWQNWRKQFFVIRERGLTIHEDENKQEIKQVNDAHDEEKELSEIELDASQDDDDAMEVDGDSVAESQPTQSYDIPSQTQSGSISSNKRKASDELTHTTKKPKPDSSSAPSLDFEAAGWTSANETGVLYYKIAESELQLVYKHSPTWGCAYPASMSQEFLNSNHQGDFFREQKINYSRKWAL